MMISYLRFIQKEDENICDCIYSEENGILYNYTLDEDYIVKAEETHFKDIKELETAFSEKGKTKKGKTKDKKSQLVKKEFTDIKQSLYFLGGSMDDFKEGIHAFKKLPQIINPYDMDYESDENGLDADEDIEEAGFGDDEIFDDMKDFQDDDDDKDFDNPNDDDFFR